MASQESVPIAEIHGDFMAQPSLESLFSDHVHPNEEGYLLMTRSWFNAITDKFDWALEDPDLGVLRLDCDHGYIVTDYDLGYPEPRTVKYNRPLNDGTFNLSRYVADRNVSLTITLNDSGWRAPSNAQLRSRLAGFLHPKRRPVLSFVEHGWNIRRRMVVVGGPMRATISQPNMNVMQVNFVCPSGLVESYEEHFADVQVSSYDDKNTSQSISHVVDIENVGDVVTMLSLPSRQNARMRRSIASLVPRVTSNLAGSQAK